MNNVTSFDDAPDKIRHTLIEEIKRYSFDAGQYKPEKEIKANLHEYTGYMLEMLWQARYDKMSVETRNAMDWLTKNLVDEKLQSKYLGSHGTSFQGEDAQSISS